MRLRHKPWADELIAEHHDIALNNDDLVSLPPFTRLEIGSGCGSFLIQKGRAEPEKSFLGVEVAQIAYSIALKKLLSEENPVKNVKFINAPVERLIDFVADGSIEEIYLNFSDPWPKKRHHKRRLTYPSRLSEYYRVLKQGGKLFFKTDNTPLYEDSKKYFEQFGKFRYEFTDEYDKEAEGDKMSEYEEKFRLKGVMIHRIVAYKD